jgi:hemolysin activation/secretion protein
VRQHGVGQVALIALACAVPLPVMAQVSLPGPAQVPQAQKRFEPPPAALRATEPDALPKPPAPIAPPKGAESVRFVLSEIRFAGMTVYPPGALRPFYSQLVGQQISVLDLYALADRITDKYRRDGYLLSLAIVPEQQVENGRVTIQIVEGFVDQLHFSGPIDGTARYPKGFAGQIAASRPLTADALERNILLIGDLPGVNVQTVLKPSATTLGAADLDIVLRQTPFEGFVSFDNHGSRFLGPYALSGGLSAHSRLGLYEQIDLTFAVDPFDRTMFYGQGNFTIPLHNAGTLAGDTLQFSLVYSEAKPKLPARIFPFKTRSENVEGRMTYAAPIIRSRDDNLTARLSFGWRDLQNRIIDLPDDRFNPAEEHVRVLQPRITYDVVDASNGVSIVDIALNLGLDIFGASKRGDPRLVRLNADGQFAYLTGMVAHFQPVARGFSLYAQAEFQLADGPLPTTERMGLGGPRLGAGFAPGNYTGDQGIAARIEARYGTEIGAGFLTGYQLYAHFDYGFTSDATKGPDDWNDLASIGVGARLNLFRGLAINPEIARQLSGTASDCLDCGHETRFLFSITQRF